jgi:hypothetical protein
LQQAAERNPAIQQKPFRLEWILARKEAIDDLERRESTIETRLRQVHQAFMMKEIGSNLIGEGACPAFLVSCWRRYFSVEDGDVRAGISSAAKAASRG